MGSLGPRDESETRIDLAADRIAYLAVSYGLLLSVTYRSFARGEAAWDLLALVVLGGIVGLAFRVSKGAVSGRGTIMIAATVGIAIVVSALLVIAGR
jgi:hypothetical protein